MGPTAYAVEDAKWQECLRKEHRGQWHCPLPGKHPASFSRHDRVTGDAIWAPQEVWCGAFAALAHIEAGRQPLWDDMTFLRELLHQFSHCLVRLDEDGNPVNGDLVEYSHPEKVGQALSHAIRKGFPINAGIRLLRRSKDPPEAWAQGLVWLGSLNKVLMPSPPQD